MFVYTPRKPQGRKARGAAGRKKICVPQKKPSTPPQRPKNPHPHPHPPAQSGVNLQLQHPPPSYCFRQQQLCAPQTQHAPPHPLAAVPAYSSSAAIVPSNALTFQPSASTPKLRTKKSAYKTLELAAASVSDLNKAVVKPLKEKTSGVVLAASDTVLACDIIAAKLNSILTSIDCEGFSGREDDLCVLLNNCGKVTGRKNGDELVRNGASKSLDKSSAPTGTTGPRRVNVFAKVNLYANSRLPAWLPPLKLYLPSYPLICLAAQSSERVYSKPMGNERETHVDSDWRLGTKAMVIKSVPVDDMNAVVLAIRGSQTFMDWAVNLNSEPASPENFLDDPGNLCHAGFLSVARRMISPIASRLRSLLEEGRRAA